MDHLSRLLSVDGEETEIFDFVFRGSSEIDLHYTKAMLPWIISEIKNQHKLIQVQILIKKGLFEVYEKDTKKKLLSHSVRQIHKCVMEQSDHRCFLYTLRPPEKDSLDIVDSSTPIPKNIQSNANYLCYLYQALTEQEVRNFFSSLRNQPRDPRIPENDSLNSLADLSVHIESQFFEVLFVGRVKVSHCKVPVTFIDEALVAFKQKEKTRRRNPSEEGKAESTSPNRLMAFQHEGSAYSVPNIALRSLASDNERTARSRSHSKDQNAGESILVPPNSPRGSHGKVRFDLGATVDEIESSNLMRSDQRSLSPASDAQDSFNQDLRQLGKMMSINYTEEVCANKGNTSTVPSKTTRSGFSELEVVGETNEIGSPGSHLSIEPMRQSRDRTASIGVEEISSNSKASNESLQMPGDHSSMRSRSGSMGSVFNRQKSPNSDSDLKALNVYDFNRTMLLHVGHREIQLINPELKSVQLNKPFKDVAGCCQGVKSNEHFGFICRELSGNNQVYVGYIFRCEKKSVAEEIMQVLNRSFSAMHEAHQRDRKEHLMCDSCPLKWFSQVCAEVEGLGASRAHSVIMKRINSLPEEERSSILAKSAGVETTGIAQTNNILMMLLRTRFEYMQSDHSHDANEGYQRSESLLGANLEESLKKAKKSLTTSLNQLLKKRDTESAEREIAPPASTTQEKTRSSPTRTVVDEPLNTTPLKNTSSPAKPGGGAIMEIISDSPLRPFRTRSSTITGVGGDSMRREIITRKAAAAVASAVETPAPSKPHVSKYREMPLPSGFEEGSLAYNFMPPAEPIVVPPITKITSPKIDMFMKFSHPLSDVTDGEINDDGNRPQRSFRQSILQKVSTPPQIDNTLDAENHRTSKANRKISTGVLCRRDASGAPPPKPKRTRQQLKVIWKKAIFQQIILARIQKEDKRIKALQKEAALQRVRLNYDEEELPLEAQQTWELLLSRPNVRIDSNVLFSGLKQGVPKLFRGDVWRLLVSQQQLFHQTARQKRQNSLPELFTAPYEEVLRELTSQQHAILIDLGRTFPGHPYFTQTLGPGQLALFNTLKAYSILDAEVGYCQGLSFIGGVILLHVEEEAAYQLLKYLMYDKGCRKQFCPDLDGLQIRMYQLSRLVHDNLRSLYEHMERHEVTPQLYAAPWFLTVFASQFPMSFVVRVFDLMFLIGVEAVFCVALVLLQTHERRLLAMSSFEDIMEHFKTVPDMTPSQIAAFFEEVCESNVKKELLAYEVEYEVLQEETLLVSPRQNQAMAKLKDANKNLKRQNLDLLEELHEANLKQQTLEASNQSLLQSQHHLEVRVRWLELEKTNLRQVVDLMVKSPAGAEAANVVPPNLERYLPNKASSPMPSRSPSPDSMRGGCIDTVLLHRPVSPIQPKFSSSPPHEITFDVPPIMPPVSPGSRQNSDSSQQSPKEQPMSDFFSTYVKTYRNT